MKEKDRRYLRTLGLAKQRPISENMQFVISVYKKYILKFLHI